MDFLNVISHQLDSRLEYTAFLLHSSFSFSYVHSLFQLLNYFCLLTLSLIWWILANSAIVITQLVGRGEGEGEDSNCNWTLGDSETLHTQVSAVSKIDSSNISKTGVEEHWGAEATVPDEDGSC